MKKKLLNNINEMVNLIERMEGKPMLNEWNFVSKLLSRKASTNAAKEAFETTIANVAKKGWTQSHDDILELVLKTQGNNTAAINALSKYTSRYSGQVISEKSVLGLLKKSIEAPETFLTRINDFMVLVPREVIDKTTGKVISFSEPYKKYLTELAENSLKKSSTTTTVTVPAILRGADKAWVQYGAPIRGNMSGWKVHIFGETVEDTAIIVNRVEPILQKWGVHGKVANDLMTQSINTGIQKGKASTLYIPPEIIKNGQTKQFIDDVSSALGSYNKTGKIYGDKSIDGTLHYRYELSSPIDVTNGVSMGEYRNLYKANDGNFNIKGNPDLFDVSKAQ